MPLESERQIHDIWHNIYICVRTCTLYTSCTLVNHRCNPLRWEVGNGEHSFTKLCSKYSFRIFSTEFFNLSVKKCYIMLMIHAPHYKWNFNLPFESDFVRVALTSLTMNGQTLACSVTLFASIGSVRWLRLNAAPLTAPRSMRESVRPLHVETADCDRSPDFVSGLRSGEDHPTLPMKRSVHWADIAATCEAEDFGINIKISPVAISTKFFSSKRLECPF